MMAELIYGSLFSGIGGFDLGFDQAGLTCAWQVEKDNAARSVLKTHWPNVQKYEDVQNVGKRNLEPVDLICGGFPCQDVSVAGRREGLAGERSGLWFEFRRIIAELGPQWVVIENVPGLLSSNGGRDMGAIVGALGEFGYWWAYRVLDAQYWGVPQRRRRVFIVGCLAKGCAQEVLFERQSSPWDTPPSREEGAELAKDVAATIKGGSGQRGYPIEWEAGLTVSSFSAGNSGDSYGVAYSENVTPPLRAGNSGTNQTPTICFVQNTRDEVRLMNGDGQIAGALSAQPGMKQQSYVANTFNGYTGGADDNDAQGRHIVPIDNRGIRRLTPLECERLQGFPDHHTAGQSDSVRYRQLGNAVAVPVARWLGKRILNLI
jgi:DNA (cytosine-5)-methyltransferase 1